MISIHASCHIQRYGIGDTDGTDEQGNRLVANSAGEPGGAGAAGGVTDPSSSSGFNNALAVGKETSGRDSQTSGVSGASGVSGGDTPVSSSSATEGHVAIDMGMMAGGNIPVGATQSAPAGSTGTSAGGNIPVGATQSAPAGSTVTSAVTSGVDASSKSSSKKSSRRFSRRPSAAIVRGLLSKEKSVSKQKSIAIDCGPSTGAKQPDGNAPEVRGI
jgi:hypothetical protein